LQRNRFYLISSDTVAFLSAYAIGCLVFLGIRHSENLFRFFFNWTSIYLAIVPISIAWFYLKGHYTRRWPFWDEMRGVCQVLVFMAVIEGALIFLTKSSFSRVLFATAFTTIFLLLPVFRLFVKWLLLRAGKWHLPTAIVGTGENATEVLHALHSERLMGFDVSFFLNAQNNAGEKCNGVPTLAMPEDVERLLSENDISCVVVALDTEDEKGQVALVERLHRFTLDLYIVPAMRGVPLYGLQIHHFFRHEVIMMRVRNNLMRPVIRLSKRCFDIICTLVLLFLLSPLLILLGLLVRRDGGPVFFAHNRIGLHGESFNCLKFRSMVTDAEDVLQKLLDSDPQVKSEWEADYKLKQDPRITGIGSFMRKSSLDELPQLFNVLKGEMSLVGPRPLIEDELKRYGEQVDYYLQVRPGMTGLWQVSGRNNVEYSHRVYLDVWYVKNWSLWYDVAILFKTFKVVLGKKGAY
jgi:Undecaprenyl-phosphate galactose phosphotransferase WbaP